MSVKIVLLDQKASHYQKLLLDRGYTLVKADTPEEIIREIEAGGAGLLIHGVHKTKSQWRSCEVLLQKYPHFPIVHVLGPGTSKNMRGVAGPFQEFIHQSRVVEDLVGRVENLMYFSEMQRTLHILQNHQEKTFAFAEKIRVLDIDTVVQHASDFLMSELECENVIWFPEGTLEHEMKSFVRRQQVLGTDFKAPERVNWRSHKSVEFTMLDEAFADWNVPLSTPRFDGLTHEFRHRSGQDVLIPFAGRPEGSVAGYLLIRKTEVWEQRKTEPWFINCMDILRKQLTQALVYSQLQSMTYKDDLTDLYNQRYLPLILEQELSRAQRAAMEFSVLFLDIDFFKLVNDTKGHLVGSKVLVEMGRILKTSIRNTDFAFRYGGDEYVVVLSGASSEKASQVAERIRKNIESTIFNANGTEVQVTVSIGIATYPEHAKTTEELLQMADEAMYYGKNKSRNIVYIAS